MSVIKFIAKISAVIAGLLVLLIFTKTKEKNQYILLNASDED